MKRPWCNLLPLVLSVFCLGRSIVEPLADEIILCGWDEVFILQTGPSNTISTNKVWSWFARDRPELPSHLRDKFRGTDECKPVNDGRQILITASSGGVALVERATGEALFYAFVGNAHSAEILPGRRLVVAGSRHERGNCLALFNIAQPEKIIYSEPLDSGHGVVWDEAREVLWALGYDELKALRLQDWTTDTPRFETVAVYALPDESGHDLAPVPGSDDLLVTTNRRVFLFNRESRTFQLHPELGSEPRIKGVSIHPRTGQTLFVQGEGGNWWSGRVQILHPAGELALHGERLYKARWNVPSDVDVPVE